MNPTQKIKIKYNWFSHLLNFVAVILGVYLAFYMNEKATLAKENKEKISILKSFSIDLQKDIEWFEEYHIPMNEEHQEKLKEYTDLLTEESFDKISDKLSVAFELTNNSPNVSTYNSVKDSDKLRLINNLSLQKKLSNFYEGIVVESIYRGQFQVDYFSHQILDWITQNVDLINTKLLHKDEWIVLRNKLIIYESLVENKTDAYKQLVDQSKILKQEIDSVLKIESDL